MMAHPTRYGRGFDGITSIRIHYQSPPPRSDVDGTLLLSKGRNLGPYQPRHSPPDACAAQDAALCKAETLDRSFQNAKMGRRDSAVNADGDTTLKVQVSDSESEAEDVTKTTHRKLTIRAPRKSTSGKSEADASNLLTPSSIQTSRSTVPSRPESKDSSQRSNRLNRLIPQNGNASNRGRSPKRPPEGDPERIPDQLRPPPKQKAAKKERTPSSIPASSLPSRKSTPNPTQIPAAPTIEPPSPPNDISPNRPVRGTRLSRHEDLSISGTSKLDPTAPTEYVTEYKFKGKWYVVVGDEGRPEWAEDERLVEGKQKAAGRRSTGAWRNSIDR